MVNPAKAIYEFSTGITFRELPNGDWVSLGFTGSYMNSSIEEIPYEVNRAIANRLFAVAEGASSDRPTVIGRVVGRIEKDQWSVIAYVSRGRDEKGRSASFYRYFLAQGPERLPHLLKYIQEKLRGDAAFNPLYSPHIEPVPQNAKLPHLSNEDYELIDQELAPLLDPSMVSVEDLNAIATHRADTTNQPVAWAYNVEALEKPHQFQAICPASKAAADRIGRVIQSKPRVSSYAVDERAIKTAVTKLTNSSTFKPQAMDSLLNGVEEVYSMGESEGRNFWFAFFDGQGVDNAIRKKIKSDQMVRLMTLRAIILPSTVAEFVDWLGPISSKNRSYDACDTSLVLQSAIKRWADKQRTNSNRSESLDYLLQSGVITLMEDAYNSPQVEPAQATLMLTARDNDWDRHWPSCIESTKRYLTAQHTNQDGERLIASKPWKKIITGMQIVNPHIRDRVNSKYRSLGKMFDRLGEPVLAACAHQAAQGFVPKDVYERAARSRAEFSNQKPYQSRSILGRKATLTEKVESSFSTMINSQVFFPAALVFLLLSLSATVFVFQDAIFGGSVLFQRGDAGTPASTNADAAAGDDRSERTLPNQSPDSAPGYENSLSQIDYEKAQRSFPASQAAVKSLVSLLAKETSLDTDIGQEAIEETPTQASKEQQRQALKELIIALSGGDISDESLRRFEMDQFLFSKEGLPQGQQQKWVNLILLYQTKNAGRGLDADGIIVEGRDTYSVIKEDLILSNPAPESNPLTEQNDPAASNL